MQEKQMICPQKEKMKGVEKFLSSLRLSRPGEASSCAVPRAWTSSGDVIEQY
jgi:hypothetical protein